MIKIIFRSVSIILCMNFVILWLFYITKKKNSAQQYLHRIIHKPLLQGAKLVILNFWHQIELENLLILFPLYVAETIIFFLELVSSRSSLHFFFAVVPFTAFSFYVTSFSDQVRKESFRHTQKERPCYRKPQMFSPIFNNRHQTLQKKQENEKRGDHNVWHS